MMKLIFLAGLTTVVFGDVSHLFNPQSQYSTPGHKPIAILRYNNEVYPDGSYEYGYDTENGISAQETGQQKPLAPEAGTSAQGSFHYTSPEGVQVQIRYVADENGFQPEGNVLPTPPPTPEAILKSLQYNAAHPEQETPFNPQQTYQAQPTYSPYRKF